ncbi:MAG: GTP cyclohydrolase I FolE [Chloroflexota bacterium]
MRYINLPYPQKVVEPVMNKIENGNAPEHPAAVVEDEGAPIENAVYQILQNIGEDPDREGLERTPNRVARMYDELTAGYHVDPAKLINGALFNVEYDEMVVVKNIDYFSLCEHHMLPFHGRIHVAYIPDEQVIGLSKIPRIVDMFSQRLQIQERLTQDIARFIERVLDPQGVAVVAEGVHMCSMMRGVKKANSTMVTQAFLGDFQDDPILRTEFQEHIGRRRFDD